ncbi:Repressor ROX1 [Mycena kentingensis (nom. inval.)]|nr:Repressor ROX1 [Mycena kentingensis (nom. inval.)]
MPALRTRDTRLADLHLDFPKSPIDILSPTPRAVAFSFPVTHNLADSPPSSPSNSPFEPDLRGLDLTGHGADDSDDTPPPPSPPPNAPIPLASQPAFVPPPPLPLSAFTRTLSPVPIPSTSSSSSSSSPPAPPAPPPRRRRNPPLDPNERRPKKGDDDYVKRPENAFILFRRHTCATGTTSAPASLADVPASSVVAGGKKTRQADLSKTISAQWRALPAEERAKWEALAREKKREHAEKHPGYVYRPQRKGSATTAAAGATFVNTGIDEHPTSPVAKRRKASAPAVSPISEAPPPSIPTPTAPPVEFVLPAPRPRSQSHNPTTTTRTPVPYQSIQIPNVYSNSPDSGFTFPVSSSFTFTSSEASVVPQVAPDDVSLLPMIAQSSGMRPDGQQNGFDYLPSFGNAMEFEASLQATHFLRAMFPPTLPSLSSSESSDSGSSPNSPYTPAASVTNAHYSTAPTPGALLEAAYSGDALSLAQPFSLDGTGGVVDPWAAYGMSTGGAVSGGAPMDFDFDLASIPGAAVGGAWGAAVDAAAASSDAVIGGESMAPSTKVEDFGSFSMDFGMDDGWSGEQIGMEGWNGRGMQTSLWETGAGNDDGL